MITPKHYCRTAVSKALPILCGVLLATAIAQGQTFTTLVNFNLTNGANSTATLVQGPDGELYGTTYSGGGSGKGTIFRVSPAGNLISLHSFTGSDGQNPIGGLVLAGQGGLIGATFVGGAYGQNVNGYGFVYRMTVSEDFSAVQSFNGVDGQNPEDTLTFGNDGNYYGTTRLGGASGNGTIVKITPNGVITVLHSFNGTTDGAQPIGGLLLGRDSNFYGVTYIGGTNSAGTIFKVSPSGTFTVLHTFAGNDGAGSVATLVLGNDGNLYGTTGTGGVGGGGTAFELTSSGVFTVLHSFNGTDGTGPSALTLGTDGNFYGTTSRGGVNGLGTVFQLTAAGAVTTLHQFAGADGTSPYAGLVQHTNGSFYGVTYAGGADADGTIFSVNMGLSPFVSLQTLTARLGGTIGVLGQGLTGTTVVTINGATASFKVISDTYLTVVVPAEASSGYVEVKTPQGLLRSSQRLEVR
jgi:uncharacterized repeat protein (TIGR03803 family)